ncbi:hypothetical protein HYU40_03185 [Candidatus Woesearchaeota archaeon]|nr:hypothetical protein [Candidatus Woesearchaeota archaeon]
MKDHRFLPVEKRQPADDYEDYAEESSDTDELFIDGEADAKKLEHSSGRKGHNTLYIAS